MIKQPPKQSAQIRTNTNDSEDGKWMGNDSHDGEPKLKKLLQGDEYDPEVGESSTSHQEVCLMEQFPVEILEIIFTHAARDLFGRNYKKGMQVMDLRLVCQTWRNILSQNRKVCFSWTVPHALLENCGFERISLRLRYINLKELPLSTWEKIGCKLNSLVLDHCKIGDQCLKNIIIHCCNLQSLKVVLKNNVNNTADLFCSPDMLKELQITRKDLGTFKIINTKETVDVTMWIQIFEVFFKIFPHVTHFTSGNYNTNDLNVKNPFKLKFFKEPDGDDMNGLATSLAFSLSANESHQRQALNACSTPSRLLNVSMCFMKMHYNDEDKITLINFFSKHRNLKCIKIVMKESISSDILKTLLFKILEYCSNLKKLQYCEDIIPVNWLNKLSKTEFFQLRTICSHLEELSINDFKFLINRSSLTCFDHHRLCKNYSAYQPRWEQNLPVFVTTYSDLQHLDVKDIRCTDDMLQKIFQHLINLKTLSIRMNTNNTNFGITGHHGNAPGVCKRHDHFYPNSRRFFFKARSRSHFGSNSSNSTSGYSINRLKNLEELTLSGFSYSELNDTIFYEFNFPRLKFLSVDSPDDPKKLLPIMGKNMPSIKKIHFTSSLILDDTSFCKCTKDAVEKSLISFCQQTEKLCEMTLWVSDVLSKNGIINLFNVCPSLRLIQGWQSYYRKTFAYYNTITCKVVIPNDYDKIEYKSDS